MARPDFNRDRMHALDEALRRMVLTCPVPWDVRSLADLLATRAPDDADNPREIKKHH